MRGEKYKKRKENKRERKKRKEATKKTRKRNRSQVFTHALIFSTFQYCSRGNCESQFWKGFMPV